LLDRVYSIKETLFHDPYYQRHIISNPLVHSSSEDRWECEANYAVFRTKLSDTTTVFNVGRSFDTLVRTANGWRFARRECIYDSEMIPNSIIYPV
jgi:salicylate 5-hydroxylase small subunit